jgi:hypothetical protein
MYSPELVSWTVLMSTFSANTPDTGISSLTVVGLNVDLEAVVAEVLVSRLRRALLEIPFTAKPMAGVDQEVLFSLTCIISFPVRCFVLPFR